MLLAQAPDFIEWRLDIVYVQARVVFPASSKPYGRLHKLAKTAK